MDSVEPIVLFIGEEEVESLIPWKCHCGNRGLSVVFKGIPAEKFDTCSRCECRIPIMIDDSETFRPRGLLLPPRGFIS